MTHLIVAAPSCGFELSALQCSLAKCKFSLNLTHLGVPSLKMLNPRRQNFLNDTRARRESRISLSLDAGLSYYFGPLVREIDEELAEFCLRTRKWYATELDQPRPEFWINKGQINFLIDFIDDRLWGIDRGRDTLPTNSNITRHKFADGRNVGKYLDARFRCDTQGAEFADLYVPDRCDERVEHDLNMTAEQIGQRWPSTTVRHV